MDTIALVDCFEKLHQHLLKHDPHLERLRDALEPYAYRSRDISFFLTHLVALLSGLDASTAEGKRRIRRLILDLDEKQPAEYVQEHLRIRDQGGVLEKPISDGQKKKLRKAIENLRRLEKERRDKAGGNASLGVAFDLQMDAQDNLTERMAWLRECIPCLSGLNAFRFLHRIGYPMLIPDSHCQRLLFRIGMIQKAGNSLDIQLETCHQGMIIAQSIKRNLLELNHWLHAFSGARGDTPPQAGLCRVNPLCAKCPLKQYCNYYRYNRPRGADEAAPLPVKQWRPADRPRERLLQNGAHKLEDSELLAIVLRTGSGKLNVLDLARKLLERFHSLQGIEEATLEELMELPGIGRMKAVELKAVFELGRRQAYSPLSPGDSITDSDRVFQAYRGRFDCIKQEEFVLLMLNTKHEVIREETISRGALDVSIVHPREVFKAAIRSSAAAVIFIHNHPSGNPEPSHDDFVITSRLEEAAELLQIRVLDHVIIGSRSYYSFTEGEVVEPPDLQG